MLGLTQMKAALFTRTANARKMKMLPAYDQATATETRTAESAETVPMEKVLGVARFWRAVLRSARLKPDPLASYAPANALKPKHGILMHVMQKEHGFVHEPLAACFNLRVF